MKTFSLQSAAGLLLALGGSAWAAGMNAPLGAWLALGGLVLADQATARRGSLAKMWAAVLAAALFSAAAAAALAKEGPGAAPPAAMGLGLLLVLMGHRLRSLNFRRWGTAGFWWVEPCLVLPGAALALWGALASGGWRGWAFAAYGLFDGWAALMGTGFALAARRRMAGGFAVEPGGPAPDFTLLDETGFPLSLGSFKGRSHALLIFVRGDWCPSCHITLRTYARHKERFQEKNVVLLAIGPDPVGVNQRMVRELGVPYKMLSDEGQKTAMAYGVQLDSPMARGVLPEGVPLPASFLVDKQGLVRYTSRPERAGDFLDPKTILPALQGLA